VRTRKVTATLKSGFDPVNLDVIGGEVWVPNDHDGTLTRIDPSTSAVIGTLRVGAGPAVVAPGAGDGWVTNFEDGSVWRISLR
jgi:YVTN family beta-propeller protein